MLRQFRVEIESALFQDTRIVWAGTARGAAERVMGDEVSRARDTVETADRGVFKDRFSPRLTVTLVEAGDAGQ